MNCSQKKWRSFNEFTAEETVIFLNNTRMSNQQQEHFIFDLLQPYTSKEFYWKKKSHFKNHQDVYLQKQSIRVLFFFHLEIQSSLPGQGNARHEHRLGERRTHQEQPCRGLGAAGRQKAEHELTLCTGTQRVKHILGYTQSTISSRAMEVTHSLYSAPVRSHLENCTQVWGLQHKRCNKPRGKPLNWRQGWSTPPMTTGWERSCSAWRTEGSTPGRSHWSP